MIPAAKPAPVYDGRWIAERLDPFGDPASEIAEIDLGAAQFAEPPAPAAVLVGLIPRSVGLSVLLTRRADTLRRHTGQIAFPGGRSEGEETPAETALREAQEEIGLDPAAVTLLGQSGRYRTGTGYLIAPVVGLVDPGVILTPSPAEVAEIFETPFAFLMDPAHHERRTMTLPDGSERSFYAMVHGERTIWGVTAAILRELSRRLGGADHA